MKPWILAHLLISLMMLASCQVKEGDAGGGLISGHRPVENIFTVGLPANGWYKSGDILSFTLTHPYAVTVTGSPRLNLNIGGSSVYADFVTGSGTKVLTFTYTVSSGDTATSGISVNSTLDLNGGTIQFDTTDVQLNLSIPNSSGIKIDTTAPTLTGATPPTIGHYYIGFILVFEVTYNEPVKVTGIPTIDLTMNECTVAGTQTKKAEFFGGNETTTLRFRYIVDNLCNETTGGMPLTTSIQLNAGTITDLAGNTAPVNFSGHISSPISNTTQVRGRYPLISSITPPASASYGPGATLDFKLTLDRIVTVSAATSYFNIKIGTNSTKRAQYVSGSGTNELIFRYTVIGGDVDADGVNIVSDLVNENTICTSGFCLLNAQTDILPQNHYAGVTIFSPIPTITAIRLPTPLPTSGYYKLGDTVQVVAEFSEVVNVSGGTPILSAMVGSTPREFTYLGGTGTTNLIFTYTIQNTDLDTDGVNFTSPLIPNGATIQNAQGTNTDPDFTFTINTGFRFDGVAPTITSSEISTVAAANYPDYRVGQYVYIDLTFSEPVTVSGSTIALTVGGVARTASYNLSVSSTVKRYRYQVQTSDHTSNQAAALVVGTTLTGGTIRDTALNNISVRTIPATDTTGVDIDGAVPTVTTVTLPSNGTKYLGQNVDFTVNFSEPVTVTGTPTWAVTLDAGGPESLSYVSGSGTSALLFRMTVDSDDVDLSGIALATSFTLTGATITDSSVGNSLTNSIPAQTTTDILLDGQVPSVNDITGPTAGTYLAGTNLDFTVTYSEAVTITGTPQLEIDIGGETKYANYQSGSGPENVVYRYTVESELTDKNGIQVTSHILNSGSVTDSAGNAADLTISTYSFGTVLVDSKGPQILSISPPSNGVRVTGDTLSFIVNFDEAVTVLGGSPSLTLDIGGVDLAAEYVSGSGSTALTFTTSALTTDHFDPGGIAYSGSALALNGATMRDSLSHDADLSFTPGNISGIKVIYSEVLSWIDVSTSGVANGGAIASLTDRSPSGNNATANSGTVTKVNAAAGLNNFPAADFDGTSSLGMNTLSVKTIVVAFKARNTPSNVKLVGSGTLGINLDSQYDLSFGANARYAVDGGTLSGPVTSCTGCYNSDTTKVLIVRYNSNQNITTILGENFDGRIAEVWILSGSQGLSTTQVEKIGMYLNSKY